MIEAAMYMGMGLLLGCLLGVAVLSPVHKRAERLTMRRLENSLPLSMAEIQVERDLLRADFAMTVRRLEDRIERLTDKRAHLEVALCSKSALLHRVTAQRDALNAAVTDLRRQLEAVWRLVPVGRNRPDAAAYAAVRQPDPGRSAGRTNR